MEFENVFENDEIPKGLEKSWKCLIMITILTSQAKT